MDYVRFIVFDEADRLMEPCFEPPLTTIMNSLPPPEDRQCLFFSATLNESLAAEIQKYHRVGSPPLLIETSGSDSKSTQSVVAELDQRYLFIPKTVKECYLVHILEQGFPDESTIIFTSTRKGCERLGEMLDELEIECVSLHSAKSQAKRMAALGTHTLLTRITPNNPNNQRRIACSLHIV